MSLALLLSTTAAGLSGVMTLAWASATPHGPVGLDRRDLVLRHRRRGRRARAGAARRLRRLARVNIWSRLWRSRRRCASASISSPAASTPAKTRATTRSRSNGAPISRAACSGSCRSRRPAPFFSRSPCFSRRATRPAFPPRPTGSARCCRSSPILGEAWSDAILARFRATSRARPQRLHGRALGLFAPSQLLLPMARAGSASRLSPSMSRAPGRRACSRCLRPPSSIGCWRMCRACRRSKSTCSPRAGRRSAPIRLASTSSFRGRASAVNLILGG